MGQDGTLLLDPGSITVSTDGSASTAPEANSGLVNNTWLGNQLASGNVILNTSDSMANSANPEGITVGAPVSWSSNNSLTLRTGGKIEVNAEINGSGTDSALILEAGPGGITQDTYAFLTVPKLAIRSKGDVLLGDVSNQVSTLAAEIGDAANQERRLAFKTSSALNIGTVDSLTGIAVSIGAGNYTAESSNGVVSLISGGSLTQTAGALIGGRALYAESETGDVILTASNPVGIVAGSSGDTKNFSFKSANPILLTKVRDHLDGIRRSSGLIDTVTLESSSGISQDGASALTPIIKASNLALTAAGTIRLGKANEVSNITSLSNPGNEVAFFNNASLSIGAAISAGKLTLEVPGNGHTLTISGAQTLNAGNSQFIAKTFALAGSGVSVATGSYGVEVFADTFTVDSSHNGFDGASFLLAPLAGGAITCDATSICSSSLLDKVASSQLQLGRESSHTSAFSSTSIPGTSTVTLNQSISRSGKTLFLVGSGNISQGTGASVTAQTLGVKSSAGNVSLSDSGNDVATFVAQVGGSLSFTTSNNLVIGSVTPYGDSSAARGVSAAGVTLKSLNGSLASATSNDVTEGTGSSSVKLFAASSTGGSEAQPPVFIPKRQISVPLQEAGSTSRTMVRYCWSLEAV